MSERAESENEMVDGELLEVLKAGQEDEDDDE